MMPKHTFGIIGKLRSYRTAIHTPRWISVTLWFSQFHPKRIQLEIS